MDQNEPRLLLARLRMEIRQVDKEIERVSRDKRFYRRLGFGQDVHEIKLAALRDERRERANRLAAVERRLLRPPRTQPSGLVSWLLLPPMLGALAVRSVMPAARRSD